MFSPYYWTIIGKDNNNGNATEPGFQKQYKKRVPTFVATEAETEGSDL